MIKVGITGNIGSGKTTVCKIFELLDIEVYYADNKAKEILHQQKTKNQIKKLFGLEVFDKNGELNNRKLADIVFQDKKSLQSLNNIIHPKIDYDFRIWADKRKTHPYVLQEAAILYETGSYKDFRKIIVVTSSENLMIERIIKRDNVSAESVKKRLNNQFDQQVKIKKADYIIYNDDKNLLIPQVIEIHNKLLN